MKCHRVLVTLCFCLMVPPTLDSGQADATDSVGERIVYYDASYDVIFAQQIDEVVRYFTLQGFRLMDTKALREWLQRKVQQGDSFGSVVLQISDVTPNEIVDPWDKSSLLYRYCENGGRYVAPAGNVLYAFEGAKDITISRQGQESADAARYLTSVFGIKYVYDLGGKGRRLTDTGKAWGYVEGPWMNSLWEGKPPEDVTQILVRSEDEKEAFLWLKTINPRYPNSGLMGACAMLCANEPLLEAVCRACVYKGKPVTAIPKVEWRNPSTEPEFNVRFSMKMGVVERRAYQRGETIPLRVEVLGKAYRGEASVLRLRRGNEVVWESRVPRGDRKRLEISEALPTRNLRCGDYDLECAVEGRAPVRESLWICPARRHNPFPWFIYKDHRTNVFREHLALQYVRDHYLNVCMADLHELAAAQSNTVTAGILGRYLDLILRENLMANARADALSLYTDDEKKDEELVLADGTVKMHGPRKAMGWRAFRDRHLAQYRDRLRTMTSVLRESKSPAIVPFFYTNDDGSMLGEYDFNEVTLADFEKRTGVSRASLPSLRHIDMGPYGNRTLFMPQVLPGIAEDDHPWLQYLRYHAGNYALINQAAMEGLQAGWPGCLVGDIGCMGGPLSIGRGYYSPIFARPFNTASFYEYPFWFHHFPFSIEVARMGNRGKPVSVVASASYTAWGRVFQRGFMYRILAEAPQYVGFWSLDARKPEFKELEDESYETLRHIGAKVASVGEFLKRTRPRRHQAAMLMPLEQLCFKANDLHSRNDYLRAAFENFLRAGARLDFISSEEVLARKASDYEVIFLNSIQWMTRGVRSELEEHIQRGGAVVVDATTTIPLEGAIKAEGPLAIDDSDLGKPTCVALCRRYVERFLKPELVTASDPDTAVDVVEADGVPVAWIIDVESEEEARALRNAQGTDWAYGVPKYLKAREAAEPVIRKSFRVREGYLVYDLWSHREVRLTNAGQGWRQGEVETQFYGAKPLALYRDHIKALQAESPRNHVHKGSWCRLRFRLRSDRGWAVRGVVPVEVAVYYPDGSQAWEYGCSGVIQNGLLPVDIPVATNDPAGKWRVAARELCSGMRSEVSFTVVR